MNFLMNMQFTLFSLFNKLFSIEPEIADPAVKRWFQDFQKMFMGTIWGIILYGGSVILIVTLGILGLRISKEPTPDKRQELKKSLIDLFIGGGIFILAPTFVRLALDLAATLN